MDISLRDAWVELTKRMIEEGTLTIEVERRDGSVEELLATSFATAAGGFTIHANEEVAQDAW